MQLKTIRIEKFRAIRSSEINVGSELALVGQNSSGKSSVLRALNAFFNFEKEKESFELGRHAFTSSSTASIDIEFENVPASCSIPRILPNSTSIRARLRYRKVATWHVFSDGQWLAAPNDLHTELKKIVRYVYVPLRRDHEVSGWGDQGLLKAAVEAWVHKHTLRRDTISPKVEALSQTIKSRAFDGLSKQLRKVTPLSGGFRFQLDYSHQPDYSLLLRDLVLKVTEGSTTVDLEDCGSGTQSMTAFALYSYLAELEGSTYILGIEEPEQNLHPQAQRELLLNLRKLPLQVLFTTHSTVMLDELHHDEVVLCRRVASTTRGIEVTTTQLPSNFWVSTGLDEDRYYQFHRRRNSEFFFSDFIILTESPIDAEIVKGLLSNAISAPNISSISMLSIDGVQSLPYAYHLLKALNLQFATVLDKDYFIPYLNDELDKSRDQNGFPRYRKEYQTGRLIESMIPDPAERVQLLALLLQNHSRAMDILEQSNIFCFKWSIEVDLVNSSIARQLLFKNFNVPNNEQTTTALLVDRKKAIKKLEVLLPVVRALKTSNLPNSYKRLKRALPELIRNAVSLR